jgi:hypothetical protein
LSLKRQTVSNLWKIVVDFGYPKVIIELRFGNPKPNMVSRRKEDI